MQRKLLVGLLCMLILISCNSLPDSDRPREMASLPVSHQTITPVPSSAVPVITFPTPRPTIDGLLCKENAKSWHLIAQWPSEYGESKFAQEAPSGEFWIVYRAGIEKYVGDYNNYADIKTVFASSFEELGCHECDTLSQKIGNMVITPNGNAWLGTSQGVIIIKQDGSSKIIPGKNIFKKEKGASAWVEAVTHDGKVLLNNGVEICLYDDKLHGSCRVLTFLGSPSTPALEKHTIRSVAVADSDTFWFATHDNRIILYNYQKEEYQEYNLGQQIPELNVTVVNKIIYNDVKDELWGIGWGSSEQDNPQESNLGVFKLGKENVWEGFKQSLFNTGDDTDDAYQWHTSIATVSDLTWVGMIHRQGLVYYDGQNWISMDGKVMHNISSDEKKVLDA